MKQVEKRHVRANPITQTLIGRSVLLFLAFLVTSCSGGGSNDSVPLGSDAILTSLSISGMSLEPAFSPSVTDYTAAVNFPAKSTQVIATSEDPAATIDVNAIAIASGVASDPIALDEGGNTITVNVTAEDSTTTQAYTVAVTRQSASEFVQRAYLKAIDRDAEDWFGFELALSADGETLALGEVGESSAATGINGDETDDTAYFSGVVYVFTRDSSGEWSQQAYIKASNAEADDWFGRSVALSADGSTLAAGASHEDSSATGVNGDQADNGARSSGAVYIFDRDNDGVWTQQAYIKASNTNAGDAFGSGSITLSDDGATMAVTALREASAATGVNGDETDNSAEYSGATYVFARYAGGVWIQQAYIKAPNTEYYDSFGRQAALSGDGTTLAVGAIFEDSGATGVNGDDNDNSVENSGAVYVYTRDDGDVWAQQAYIKASNADADDSFGLSVALSADGSTLAVCAPGEDSAATGVNGDDMDNNAYAAGAAYVFNRDSAGTWAQQAYVKASNTDEWDGFGGAIGLSSDGSMLVVGSAGESSAATGVNGDDADNSAPNAGAVYVFTRDSRELWTQRAYIKSTEGQPILFFGSEVAVSGGGMTLAVDAIADPGAIYFFEL